MSLTGTALSSGFSFSCVGKSRSERIVPPSVLNKSVASGLKLPSAHRNLTFPSLDSPGKIVLQLPCLAATTPKKIEALMNAKHRASTIFYLFFLMYFFLKMPRLMLTKMKKEPKRPQTMPMTTAAGISQSEDSSSLSLPNLRAPVSLSENVEPDQSEL